MLEIVLLVLIFIGGLLILIGIGMGISDWVHAKPISSLSDLKIPKTTFVQLVIEWCHSNIDHTSKTKPNHKVRYHQSKVNGEYRSRERLVVVNFNTHQTILEVVETTIHEFIHHTQSNRSYDRLYNHYDKEYGYWDNPFEVESRTISDKYKHKCLQDLINTYDILK